MSALLALRCQKTVKGEAKWNERRMARSDFPLSKNRTYILGPGWSWQVWHLEGGGHTFRLLIAFHVGKCQYQAWLGLEDGNDLALLGKLEYHPSHHGWHMHVRRGSVATVARGVVKESRDYEKCRLCRSKADYDVTESNATAIAFRAFNVTHPGVGLFA